MKIGEFNAYKTNISNVEDIYLLEVGNGGVVAEVALKIKDKGYFINNYHNVGDLFKTKEMDLKGKLIELTPEVRPGILAGEYIVGESAGVDAKLEVNGRIENNNIDKIVHDFWNTTNKYSLIP